MLAVISDETADVKWELLREIRWAQRLDTNRISTTCLIVLSWDPSEVTDFPRTTPSPVRTQWWMLMMTNADGDGFLFVSQVCQEQKTCQKRQHYGFCKFQTIWFFQLIIVNPFAHLFIIRCLTDVFLPSFKKKKKKKHWQMVAFAFADTQSHVSGRKIRHSWWQTGSCWP